LILALVEWKQDDEALQIKDSERVFQLPPHTCRDARPQDHKSGIRHQR
jgi:hypothetical protein